MEERYIYMLASKRNGTIYTGVTNDLKRRIWEHKTKYTPGFTSEHDVHLLVYFEVYTDYEQSALRERRLKKWKREWKIDLIEQSNPQWKCLYDSL